MTAESHLLKQQGCPHPSRPLIRMLRSLVVSRPKHQCRGLAATSAAATLQWLDVLSHYQQSRRAPPPPPTSPTTIAFPPVFKACATLHSTTLGTAAHADAIKRAAVSHTSTCNSITTFYLNCGMPRSALLLFSTTPTRDSVSWNAIIHGFLTRFDLAHGLGLFAQSTGIPTFVPNVSTLVLVLQACWKLETIDTGSSIHGFIIKIGFFAVLEVQNSLLSLYVKSLDLLSAEKVFDEMTDRNVISWSALLSGYAQGGRESTALRLFRDMSLEDGIDVDGLAVVGVLQACSGTRNVEQGRLIHGHLIRRGFGNDLFVGNSLIDMYSKCSDVDSAREAFGEMVERNVVSWNSFLSGLVHNEKYVEALELFSSMKEAGVEAVEVTMVTLLRVSKWLGQAAWCKCIHSVIIRRLFQSNVLVMNSLLDAYAKCGLMELALKTLEQMEERNVVSWSTMIGGFAHCGQPEEAVACFREMMLVQEKANSVAMLSLLDACAVSAELKLAKFVHGVAVRLYLASDLAVGTALLHMYAKCGDVRASRNVFRGMPERNILTWNAMIGALGMNGCAQEAIALLHKMESETVKPNGVTMLQLLSACSHGGLVEEGLSCFRRMMQDSTLQPELEHYSCVVDMLGRAGHLKGALEAIKRMPEGLEAGPAAWGALLSACRSQGEWELGQGATSHVLELEPSNAAGYLLSSSLYAKGGLQDQTARMRLLMKQRGVRVASGYSLVHIDQTSHRFIAWDASHLESKEIYSMVELLHGCIKGDEKSACPTIYKST